MPWTNAAGRYATNKRSCKLEGTICFQFLRIEVHFSWNASQRFTCDQCCFISQCRQKKVYFNPYIYAQAMKNPKKYKNKCQFFVQCLWKIFATVFLCFIAGECHGSVNINYYKFISLELSWRVRDVLVVLQRFFLTKMVRGKIKVTTQWKTLVLKSNVWYWLPTGQLSSLIIADSSA